MATRQRVGSDCRPSIEDALELPLQSGDLTRQLRDVFLELGAPEFEIVVLAPELLSVIWSHFAGFPAPASRLAERAWDRMTALRRIARRKETCGALASRRAPSSTRPA